MLQKILKAFLIYAMLFKFTFSIFLCHIIVFHFVYKVQSFKLKSKQGGYTIQENLGIGIEKTNAGIGIPASRLLVRYWTTKMPDCVSLVRYRTCSGIVSFFQSGTGLTGCWTVWHSGISIYLNIDIDIGMGKQH